MRRTSLLATFLFATLLSSGAAFAQAPAATPAPVKKGNGLSPKEAEAINAMFQSQAKSPDEQIAAADALLTKFADTAYKGFALELEAEAYQKKGDNAKAIVYGEQALEADPKNYDADNLLANVLAATTRDTDLDKEEKLTKADKYAHDAMDALELGKPPLFAKATDEAWAQDQGRGSGTGLAGPRSGRFGQEKDRRRDRRFPKGCGRRSRSSADDSPRPRAVYREEVR